MTPLDEAAQPADPTIGCEREPIHHPGSIQPHGHLLAFEGKALRLSHASAGAAAILAAGLPTAFGQPAARILHGPTLGALVDGLRGLPELGQVQLGRCQDAAGQAYQAIGHRSPDGHVILELETEVEAVGPQGEATLEVLYPGIRDAFTRLGRAATLEELAGMAAATVRRITGFDRVLIYRFEENWDGVVLAEDGSGRLPAYLGLRFPASDIPAQARRLYEANPQRLIADVDYTPVSIHPAREGPPLDLTQAGLRSVSPVHREYMRNMGTPASMSVSVLRGDGRLWGLISCHHAEPRQPTVAARNICDLIGQIFAVRVAAREETAHAEARARLRELEGRLLARMATATHIAEGLLADPDDLLGLASASGAAVLADQGCTLVGRTPTEAEVRRIGAWIAGRGQEEVFATAALGTMLPGAEAFADTASGVLAVSISRLHPSFVLWFRPEVVSTVQWGGDPRKPQQPQPQPERLHPRRSFAAWVETVRGRSAAWTRSEIEAARDLRGAILGVVLRAAEERAALAGRLEQVNRELAAFSYSVSHDLRAPFRHIVGFTELLREQEGDRLGDRGRRYLGTISQAAETAGHLVDALLAFSQMGRSALMPLEFDSALLVREVIQSLELEQAGRTVEWRIGPLPSIRADPAMLRQVFHNLLSNALKYTRGRDPAVIGLGCRIEREEYIYSVCDNGAGFDMAYAHKLFGVFQRLHRPEEFEGVGIGLANVRRIVERHGGRVWAEGRLGEGAVFHFSLPARGAPSKETT
ncbi:ATP-binding protein [Roseicella frigidaeris]|uniref:histidine kinase n=1 Tax=Roseicella frigidaeris TaxID=2230885 RepID=A0A327M8X0_9PROT|nr:ATP-binding protein [Roseicella frigidaeris]RAI58806.1 ATPase [Roseicella frigidaeris]